MNETGDFPLSRGVDEVKFLEYETRNKSLSLRVDEVKFLVNIENRVAVGEILMLSPSCARHSPVFKGLMSNFT